MVMNVRIGQCFAIPCAVVGAQKFRFFYFLPRTEMASEASLKRLVLFRSLAAGRKPIACSEQRLNGTTGINIDQSVRPPSYRGFGADVVTGQRVLNTTMDGHRHSRTLV